MSTKASGSDAKGGEGAKHRAHHDGSSGRSYTVEQKAAVLRVRRCNATAFYDILGLEEVKTTCSESDIKKAYRKLSLLTHPDKNGYDGADEAFKMVSRAFQVLSDPDKKTKFDKFGMDPDSRFQQPSSSSSPFGNGFARSPAGGGRGGPMFEEELTPEELFRQFFGGGAGGPFGFDGGPGFVFNFGGGPGFRVHQFGGAAPRMRPRGQNQPQVNSTSLLTSLLPVILLFIIPLLSSLFSGSSSSVPAFRMDRPVKPHIFERTTANLGVHHWVNPNEIHGLAKYKLDTLDRHVEQSYLTGLKIKCEEQVNERTRMMHEAQGWFWRDEELMEKARNMEMTACAKLRELGVR
ncbi:DUF1977-domain-containing protein [Trichodelitschia bisporula]|uniref:DUF1977-domain-containing protein n=1 Tax=Trichodelitschia bisporula TaxID=703511 RepID=A0A6G1HT81_9PEZI|nr:DUF1977-domain-containing protein [Trichodelitschia bisporula]